MSFVLRRPSAITSTLGRSLQLGKPVVRQLHQTSSQHSFFSRASAKTGFILCKQRETFRSTIKRNYNNFSPVQSTPTQGGDLGRRLLYGVGIFGGTLVAINLVFNRETREDGGMPPFEREYLNDTFLHTGLGLGTIAIVASALHRSGWSVRVMSANPWLVAGLGLAGSIGTMIAARSTSPDNYVAKYGFWTGFNVCQAALLSPLLFVQPALLFRASLYTAGMMGSIAFVGATAKQEKYLYLGAPLLAGVAVVALSGLAPLIIPVTATRTLMWTENLWLYGGLAVFGGFTLYDFQKILRHARLAQSGLMQKDAVNEAIGLELDFLNIFIRMVQILGMQQNRRK